MDQEYSGVDRFGSDGLPIHHLDRPDIYFPDVYSNCTKISQVADIQLE